MKTKNRVLNVLLAAALACSMLMLSACGGGKSAEPVDLSGTTWALAGGAQGSTKVSKADMETLMGGEITYTFNEDGTLSMALAGTAIADGTWSQDGANVTLTVAGESGEMKLDGDTLSITQGDVVANFTQKK